jgi:hypothetical protein
MRLFACRIEAKTGNAEKPTPEPKLMHNRSYLSVRESLFPTDK